MPLVVLLEIAFRTTFMFVYAVGLIRISGARALSQLSMAEVVLVVGLGAAIGDPMFYLDVPIVHGLVVITLVVLLQRLTGMLAARNNLAQRMLEPRVICLVSDGKIDEAGVTAAMLSRPELFAELRQAGVENLAEVKRAYLEPDGNFSVFTVPPGEASGEDRDLLEDADQMKAA
jgi:uncharacterized membrane protein YcaP (DUF421 family)